MVGEDALLEATGGDFNLVLIAVLVFSLIGAFIWALKMIIAQNQRFQDNILSKMNDIVQALKDYKCDTEKKFDDHDQRAERIGKDVSEMNTTLNRRPCIRDDRR
jgi:nitrogen fixation-related uncharacterized protein